ncbi:MAG: ABC transporter permease subunit [Chloroflexota bacterium]
MTFNTTLTIARLTVRETQRRRVLWVALLMGLLFLIVFGLGFHFIYVDVTRYLSPQEARVPFLFFSLAGLYATNFLMVMMAVLISVAAVSGEIDSHTIETLLTKPIRRWEVIMGKWIGFAFLILLYLLLLSGGIILIVYLRAGFVTHNIVLGLALMYLEALVVLTISIAGGTRLSTLANGAMAFMLYGLAFVGGWVEQIGAILRNETAVDIGILASLIMPGEVLWKKASSLFQPQTLLGDDFAGPFVVASQPSNAMIVYAVLYVLVLLALALWSFARRDL